MMDPVDTVLVVASMLLHCSTLKKIIFMADATHCHWDIRRAVNIMVHPYNNDPGQESQLWVKKAILVLLFEFLENIVNLFVLLARLEV